MNLITQGILELMAGLAVGVLLNQTLPKISLKRRPKAQRELRNYTIKSGSLRWMIDREFRKRNQLKN